MEIYVFHHLKSVAYRHPLPVEIFLQESLQCLNAHRYTIINSTFFVHITYTVIILCLHRGIPIK